MSNVKKLFSSPKRAAVCLFCAGVIVVALGVCIVASAAGLSGQSAAIGGERAQKLAFADAGVDPVAAAVVEVKYESFGDGFVYEVEFTAGDTEYEYKIDAEDGSVVKKESKTVKGAGSALPGALTLEEARDIALADAGVSREQAVFTKAEPDLEDGLSIYEFEFYAENVEYEYEINAQTGSVYSKSVVTYAEQKPAATPAPVQSAPPVQETQRPVESTPTPTQKPAATTPPSTPAPAPTQPQQTAGQTYIGLDAAKTVAMADAGTDAAQAYFTKAELDYEDGVPVYEIEFCTSTHEYEYEIHAATGAVCHRSSEMCSVPGGHHSGGHHSDPHHNGYGCIGINPAKNAALSHAGCSAGQVYFTKAELDDEDGRAVYEIEFYKDGVEYEYTIDAATGAVLEYEWDQD